MHRYILESRFSGELAGWVKLQRCLAVGCGVIRMVSTSGYADIAIQLPG